MFDTSKRHPPGVEYTIALVITLISIPYAGWVLSLVWNWYLVDIVGARPIDVRQAIALGFCLVYLRYTPDQEYPVESGIKSLVMTTVFLAMAGIYYYVFY